MLTILRKNTSGTLPYLSAIIFLTITMIFSAAHANHSEQLEKTYPRGDAYFLIGNLENDLAAKEFANFVSIARWLGKAGFKPILTPGATVSDLREAVQNPRTSVIIWSSHGSPSGEIMDVNKVPLPKDIFANEAGPRLSNVIVSACYGECIVKSFQRPAQMQWVYWNGKTSSDALHAYLVSAEFEKRLFNFMRENPMSVGLPGGALPDGPHKVQEVRCSMVFR